MRNVIKVGSLLFMAVLFMNLKVEAQSFKLEWPFKAVLYKEIYPVNYVDQDTAKGKIKDHNCGDETYDGHQGTDFVLRSFRQMDSGVVITAAAAGRVVYAVDTFFDRNKSYNKSLGYGNYINIKHDSNYYTIYAHLRKHTARVHAGDSVKAGDTLGLIGASGYAVDPHLHFELWNGYTLIDPFSGACGPARSYWKTQPPYDTTYGIIDHGMVNIKATLDTLREDIPAPVAFSTKDSFITFWIHEYGIHDGDTSQLYWYTPKSTYWYSYIYPHTFDTRYYYWWSYIGPVSDTGMWTVYYEVNHKVKVTEHFRVVKGGLGTENVSRDNYRIKVVYTPIAWLLSSNIGIETVDIYNVTGGYLKTLQAYNAKEVQLPLEALSPGIYMACVHTTAKTIVNVKLAVF